MRSQFMRMHHQSNIRNLRRILSLSNNRRMLRWNRIVHINLHKKFHLPKIHLPKQIWNWMRSHPTLLLRNHPRSHQRRAHPRGEALQREEIGRQPHQREVQERGKLHHPLLNHQKHLIRTFNLSRKILKNHWMKR